MIFNDWTTNLIDQDNITLQLETNSFVFINGNNPVLVFPETAQEFDVIYFYAFRPSDLASADFHAHIKANGSTIIINSSGDETWTSGPYDYLSGRLFEGLHMAIFVQGSWRFHFSNFLCVSSSIDNTLYWYLDNDGDGYGDYYWSASQSNCPPDNSGLWVNNNEDCNDGNPDVNPGATEIEDGIDNDCDGEIDEGFNQSGTVTDIDGNTYDYLTYGDQVWTVDNAEMVTYRDGTPIPQVTDAAEWANITTGAWCYYNNDPTKPRLYNWYAVMGIHDTDPNTPNKEFAPEGWHVPTDAEWTTLEEYLIANGYNYDGTTTENKIAKAMASTTGWDITANEGTPGNDQSTNNSSGFSTYPEGARGLDGDFFYEGEEGIFWSSTENINNAAWIRSIYVYAWGIGINGYNDKRNGLSVRFVKD